MYNYLRQKLSQEYKKQKCYKPEDCLKLAYQFNAVKVALYFDEYDEITYNLCLILSYGDDIYFTRIDIDVLAIQKLYLDKIPSAILNQIKEEGGLDNFYDVMRDKIQNAEIKKSSYKNPDFKQAVNKSKTNDEIFFWYLKQVNMREEHLEFLHKKLDISLHILRVVKNQGYTIATTNDISKRKKLTYILKDNQIKI